MKQVGGEITGKRCEEVQRCEEFSYRVNAKQLRIPRGNSLLENGGERGGVESRLMPWAGVLALSLFSGDW